MQQLAGEGAKAPKMSATAVFHAELLDWSKPASWIVDFFHTDGKKCPHCGVEIVDDGRVKRWYQGDRIKCSACDRFYTSRTNTPMDGSTLDNRELFLLKCLIEWQVPVSTIVSIIAINKETVARWEKRFHDRESLSA